MNTSMIIELAGYLGSVLVVVSMLMSSVVKLRIINTAGSIISATYALIIQSYPLALMNICLIIINIYNLARLLRSNEPYDLVDMKTDDIFLTYFLDYYQQDIQNFFPAARSLLSSADTAYMICCSAAPAGLLLGKKQKDGTMDILIDYTTPMYRDCSAGSFLYSKLQGKGINSLVYSGNSEKHIPYLQKMGFINENGSYVKHLSA